MKDRLSGLLQNNSAYAERFDDQDLQAPPRLGLAVLTCMDARLDLHKILGLQDGDAHIIRNAGGVLTEDALRSLVISQRLLGTAEIMLIRHTECGLMALDEEELERDIEQEVGERPPFSFDAFSDLEEDLRQTTARIKSNPFLSTNTAVRSFVYDVRTGLLNEVGD